jgi:alpha/beta superfamily hydrolase
MSINRPNDSFIVIEGSQGALEVVLTRADRAAITDWTYVVIICHPHPLHGGTMDNKVVTTLMRTYRDLRVDVVRFNFRGVGKSEGCFDQGRGELLDLLAVVDWVRQEYSAVRLLLAGFSFGSAIAAQASHLVGVVHHLLLVAPPIERYDYDCENHFSCPVCVVQGDCDERVSAQGVYDWVSHLQTPVELLRYPEASHFFHGYLAQLKTDLTRLLGARLHEEH